MSMVSTTIIITMARDSTPGHATVTNDFSHGILY